jgi:hypothetical protein
MTSPIKFPNAPSHSQLGNSFIFALNSIHNRITTASLGVHYFLSKGEQECVPFIGGILSHFVRYVNSIAHHTASNNFGVYRIIACMKYCKTGLYILSFQSPDMPER